MRNFVNVSQLMQIANGILSNLDSLNFEVDVATLELVAAFFVGLFVLGYFLKIHLQRKQKNCPIVINGPIVVKFDFHLGKLDKSDKDAKKSSEAKDETLSDS